jgi:hypothetical protein
MEHLLPEAEDEASDPDPASYPAPGHREARPAGPALACARRALSLEEATLV